MDFKGLKKNHLHQTNLSMSYISCETTSIQAIADLAYDSPRKPTKHKRKNKETNDLAILCDLFDFLGWLSDPFRG